ncbi:unnamed protein product [Candidula unifasciata]|uniref:C2 domain-containing protein n=1 Tax=Candidula unifasciata TaxID=100452 RepID=A0A8S3ZAF1_9EUPU|nr:unnamed protein product [Candidula unifasciata]
MYIPALTPEKGDQGKKSQRGSWHPLGSVRESEISDWSDVSLPEIIEMKQDPNYHPRRWSRTSDYSSGASTMTSQTQYESRLAYGLIFDRTNGKLHVRVIQLGNFRVMDPDGVMAPYVKVCVYRRPKHFFKFKTKSPRELHRSHLTAEAQTKILRRSDNPVFNETLTFNVDPTDISPYALKFLVCDFDKYSRHVNIGEVTCDLSKMELTSGQEVLFNDLLLEPQEEDLGELHVALMYLPTSEKLNVTILDAKDLRLTESPRRNTDVYTKIVLMYDGRSLKKTKTAAKPSQANLMFNESFVFDVPVYQLDKVYFIITTIEVEKEKGGRYLLGRSYIGVNFDPRAKAQWLEMVQNARKQVACWHKLQY